MKVPTLALLLLSNSLDITQGSSSIWGDVTSSIIGRDLQGKGKYRRAVLPDSKSKVRAAPADNDSAPASSPGNSGNNNNSGNAYGHYGKVTVNNEPNEPTDTDESDYTHPSYHDTDTVDSKGNVVCVGPGNSCGGGKGKGVGGGNAKKNPLAGLNAKSLGLELLPDEGTEVCADCDDVVPGHGPTTDNDGDDGEDPDGEGYNNMVCNPVHGCLGDTTDIDALEFDDDEGEDGGDDAPGQAKKDELEEYEDTSRRQRTRKLRGSAYKQDDSNKAAVTTQRILQDEGIETWPIGLFSPLICDGDTSPVDWSTVPLTSCTSLSAAYPSLDETTVITVPCGTCYEYDLPSGMTTTIGGLDIHGKLYVPPNYQSTLRTPHVFVQGMLSMSDTNTISPDNTSMKIVLIGDTVDQWFTPVHSNANVDNGVFNAGIKPFVVAGGQLDIRGWDGDITEVGYGPVDTWTNVLAMAEADPPNPVLSNTFDKSIGLSEFAPIDPPMALVPNTGEETLNQCDRKVVHHDFGTNVDHSVWSGGDGKIVHYEENLEEGSTGTIALYNLDKNWQGFKLDFTEIAQECPLIQDAKYLLSLRIKIDLEGSQGQMPECSNLSPVDSNPSRYDECPRLQRQIMHSSSDTAYDDRYIQKGSGIAKYGEWFWFSTIFQWNANDLTDVIGQTFRLRNFPVGATVHLDEFIFELPSSKSYANPDNVCTEIVVNGNPIADELDGMGSATYPWTPRWPNSWSAGTAYSWYAPYVVEEDANKFYRVGPQSDNYGMEQELNPDCFVLGYIYTVSARLRIHEYTGNENTLVTPYLQLKAVRENGSETYPNILTFPSIKMGDGWVTASADLVMTEDMEDWKDVELRVRTNPSSGGKHLTLDVDDVSIYYKHGPAEGLAVDPTATTRWGAGSEVHITSTTLNWKDSQDAVISEVINKADGGVSLKLDKGIEAVLTEADTPGMGAEVVLVSRNIKIEGDVNTGYCGSDRLKQNDYRGTTSVTKSGFECQNWTAQSPHSHSKTTDNYPDSGLGDHNYCRNPDGESGAWCYTTNPDKRWELCDIPECQGAYLQVFHTPDVAQKIEGVEFKNVGQEKKKGRFPINFLYTRDVSGTSISRNSIHYSAHRCISMDGVSGATIAGNTAVDTAGHCYYIGFEATSNVFLNNIGSRLNTLIDGSSETLSGYNDYNRATFLIENPSNDFIGNVAAGSSNRGFEADLDSNWRGEDNSYKSKGIGATSGVYRGYPRRMPAGAFRSNKAHSNYYIGFNLYHFEQYFEQRNPTTNVDHFPIFENIWCYRHREYGINAYNLVSAKFLGGKLSDNSRYGLRIRYSDRLLLSDFDIVGSSQIFKDHTVNRDLKLCTSSSWRHQGLVTSPMIYRKDYRDPNLGMRLINVNISGYDKEKTWYPNCKSTEPYAVENPRFDGHWDYISSVTNVNIQDSRGMFIDGCRALNQDYNDLSSKLSDIVITDADGSFGRSLGFDSSATFGAFVHDKKHVTSILGDTCTSVGSCFAYCSNVCLRTFSFKVEQYGTENWVLRLNNTSAGTSMDIPGTIYLKNEAHFDDYASSRSFSASIPSGNYTAEFIDESGGLAWPTTLQQVWNKAPDCSGYAVKDDITLIKPEVDETFCSELVRNGGQSGALTTVEPWINTFGDSSSKKIDLYGTDAFRTINRSSKYSGPGQNIDSRCIDLMKGQLYEFTAYIKVTAKNNPTSIATNIYPNKKNDANQSPVGTIYKTKYRDDEFFYYSSDIWKIYLARPYQADDSWNLLHGIFRIPDTQERVFFEIERAPDNLDMIINSASLLKMTCDETTNLVLNGDMEMSQTKYWDTWGSTVGLDLVTPGYGGIGQALIGFDRPDDDDGPSQWINTDCVAPGERIMFTAKVRFEVNGVKTDCNSASWVKADRCAEMTLYRRWKDGTYTYSRVGEIATDDKDGDWYDISGIFQLPASQSVADDYTKLFFDEADPTKDIIIDNVEAKVLELQCNQLIENPSFSQGSLFWKPTDRERQKLRLYPGADGEGDYALRAFDRDSSWRGIRQQLDTRCFVEGEEYTISAKFRLLNATTGEGLGCDVNDLERTGENCPSILLRGYDCTIGGDSRDRVNQRFWNTIKEWDAAAFNQFETSFTINDALSSCEEVWVFVNEVDKEQEIVVDDLYISLSQTASPTESTKETYAPTITPPTGAPTTSPTPMPTLPGPATPCPTEEGIPTEVPSGPIKLAHATNVCVLTKATTDNNGVMTNIAPVAISYDGRAWEKAAGSVATELLYGQEIGIYNEGCQIDLPALTDGAKYYLTSHSHTASADDEVARLLEQGTFGTTASDIAAFGSATAKDWVVAQMNITATSHREFLRKRTNMRLTNPVFMGRNSHPCDENSRWRTYAFSRKEGDEGIINPQIFEAVHNATGSDDYITIKLNGHVRTVVSSLEFEAGSVHPLEFDTPYELCNEPKEFVGGDVKLLVNGACQTLANPLVHFYEDSAQPAKVVNLPAVADGILEHINDVISEGGDYILTQANGLNDPVCDELSDIMEELDAAVFGKLPDGSWLVFDPMMVLETNTLEQPIPDGGGLVRTLTAQTTRCSNVPRTFLNEDSCYLSDSSMACGSVGAPNLMIELNSENIEDLHILTGQYVYTIDGLPLRDSDGVTQPSPCTLDLRSRWEIMADVNTCTQTTMGEVTLATLTQLLLSKSEDPNPKLRDITFGKNHICDFEDAALVEVDMIIEGVCYRRVHPEHLSVYDFSAWALDDTPGAHPGNMMAMMHDHPNPIKKWMDIDNSIILVYPASVTSDHPHYPHLQPHPIWRWDTYSPKFPKLGRFGDEMKFVDLPNEIRLDEVAEYFGADTNIGGGGVMVCGSPFEVDNDPTFGKVFQVMHRRDTDGDQDKHREHIWQHLALTANDQLRQRAAWAFAQILVIAQEAVSIEDDHSEAFLTYYDIFVRHAFGNYRDMLREISYSPIMAENLSFLQSKSAAYQWEVSQKVSFADENFAREIMQLFSTGLEKLNLDGTPVLDENGDPVLAYTNDEIMSFARVWTGFDYQQGRGNVEEASWSGNRHDPMRIQAGWRDKFPKTDMNNGYIGDGYPLCVDLPERMFLAKGAEYRLLGASFMPELMEDESGFKTDTTLKKFKLNSTASLLYDALCTESASGCTWNNTVILESTVACTGDECNADTLRVIEVGDGLHYEYVRPACVEQAFFDNAVKVIYKDRNEDSSCANPLLPYASEACCDGTFDIKAERYSGYLYDQERVTFATANARCEDMGKMSCDFDSIEYKNGLDKSYKKGYHWTTDSCSIQVKVNEVGHVALVYEPESYEFLHPHIRSDTRNYFKVFWDGDFPVNDLDATETLAGNACASVCESLANGGCLCNTEITESRVFGKMPSSVDEVFEKLSIGAFDPDAYPAGTYLEVLEENGVKAYLVTAGLFGKDTVFEVFDEYNRLFRYKNTYERVQIQGTDFAFRNAPSFMSVLNTEADARDAYYETEAALDHYFYHDNTAPFIALRLIQRFTTSNPKPRYVKAVAEAFRSGKYDGDIGTGEYGDLAATIAAVLLDPEARSINLDADPFKGGLKEPLIRVMALLRGIEVELAEGVDVLKMRDLDDKIGQMAHTFPSVFSFFLPEYKPSGRAGEAGLVGPETMIMDMPRVVSMLNGMFSVIKHGVTRSCNGFGTSNGVSGGCGGEGNFNSAKAIPMFSRPWDGVLDADVQANNVVTELATIFTSGRLGNDSKALIVEAYKSKLLDVNSADPAGDALRVAQQLIWTAPETHTTSTVNRTGSLRDDPPPSSGSGVPYKAIVYVMFGGGCDSYNMLVPHTCSQEIDNMTLWDEYNSIRVDIALEHSELLVLNETTNQACEHFGVHPSLGSIQEMYNEGDLLFFSNTGVLTKPTNRKDYNRDTVTQLFAHNFMQKAAKRVDPLKEEEGTGILGRIRDVLVNKTLSVGAFSLSGNSIALIGSPGLAEVPMILGSDGVTRFNSNPSVEGDGVMANMIAELNGKTTTSSGVFGEWFSDTLTTSLVNNKNLYETLETVSLTGTDTFPTSSLGKQLKMVSKMIKSREVRGSDADMFYTTKGGWDTHTEVKERQIGLFNDVDASFKAFADEMKAQQIWDHVTLIETSDFARTLNQNGNMGSDHAWGGNYIMMGGGVKGRQIVGTYPQIKDGAPLNINRGRMVPTTSWESVFKPLAEWAGVETEAELDYVLPNRHSFPAENYSGDLATDNLFEPTV